MTTNCILLGMKVALVYDRVNKIGGAERVLVALHKIYPNAPLFTLVHNPETTPWAKVFKVIPTFFNQIPFLRTRHEWLAPFAPLAFETLNFNDFDLVISITSADAKSIITTPKTLHICYCLTPTRYFYVTPFPKLLSFALPYFKNFDLIASRRPDFYLAISTEVQTRIKKYYHQDSQVIYPPIEYNFFAKVKRKRSDYYLVVSRLVPYKKIDLVIEALKKLNKKAIIIGDGSLLEELKIQATGSQIRFLGQVSDVLLRQYYAGARAVIFPQLEDFGLVPLEAAACGTPTIAFCGGGAKETVLAGVTGIYFDSQTSKSLIAAIRKFENMEKKFHPTAIKNFAKKFNETLFRKQFSGKVKEIWDQYHHPTS